MIFLTKKTFVIVYFTVTVLSVSAMRKDSTTVINKPQSKSLTGIYQIGTVLPSNDFVLGKNAKGRPISNYQSFAIQFAVETDGRTLWQQLYNFPSYGAGLNTYRFFNTNELGNPISLYGFFRAPFVRFKKWSINYDIGTGISFNWNQYHPLKNPYNYAIGSDRTAFVDIGIFFDFQLGKHLDLSTGVALNHFSNGAGKVPNMGINTAGARISLKYIFNSRPQFIERDFIPKYKKQWEFLGVFAFSHKQMAFDTLSSDNQSGFISQDYNIYNFSIGVNRQLGYKIKLGMGLDFGYDESYNSYIVFEDQMVLPQSGYGNKWSVGVYPSFEWVIKNLSVILQPGWYLYRSDPSIPETTHENHVIQPRRTASAFYQRVGIKYHIFNHIILGLNVRAYNFSVADYFEWNIGYRIIH
jgi:hypothetical protein